MESTSFLPSQRSACNDPGAAEDPHGVDDDTWPPIDEQHDVGQECAFIHYNKCTFRGPTASKESRQASRRMSVGELGAANLGAALQTSLLVLRQLKVISRLRWPMRISTAMVEESAQRSSTTRLMQSRYWKRELQEGVGQSRCGWPVGLAGAGRCCSHTNQQILRCSSLPSRESLASRCCSSRVSSHSRA